MTAVLALCLAAAIGPLAHAADGQLFLLHASAGQPEEGQRFQAAPPRLDISEAASRAQERHGGQLISIRPAEQDGQQGWQATVLLENGRVKTLFVESATGAVMDRRQRD